jgi:predicted Zn-dependent protease
MLLSKALSAVKDQLAAEDAANKAIGLDPISPTAQSNLIDIQFSGGKEESALMSARAYVSAHPGPTADLILAETLRRAKRTNEATALLEKRLATKPDAVIASALAQFAKDSGDSKKAVAILANWLAKSPNDTMIRLQYGDVLLSTGDEEGARKQYEVLLKQAPENPLILNNLAWTLQKDDPVRALSLASLAAKISPGSSYIADTLGWLKMQGRDSQGALLLFQRAHARDPNNPTMAYHLVLALDATGKRADAKALLLSTLAKNSKFDGAEDAKRLLARW